MVVIHPRRIRPVPSAGRVMLAVALLAGAAACSPVQDDPPANAGGVPGPAQGGPGAGAGGGEHDGGWIPSDGGASDQATTPPSDASAGVDAGADAGDAALPRKVTTVWNGDSVTGGAGWATPSTNPISIESSVAHVGAALLWDVVPQSVPWSEWGYNWKGFQKPGTPASSAVAFTFYVKLAGNHPPSDIVVSLRSAIDDKYAHQPPAAAGLRGVSLAKYAPSFADGAWHRVSLPMADVLAGENAAEFAEIFEVFMGAAGSDYRLYLDDLAFEQ